MFFSPCFNKEECIWGLTGIEHTVCSISGHCMGQRGHCEGREAACWEPQHTTGRAVHSLRPELQPHDPQGTHCRAEGACSQDNGCCKKVSFTQLIIIILFYFFTLDCKGDWLCFVTKFWASALLRQIFKWCMKDLFNHHLSILQAKIVWKVKMRW